MIELSAQNLNQIQNPRFREYAQIYTGIYESFLEQIQVYQLGYQNSPEDQLTEIRTRLKSKGAILRNDNKSIYINWISPACEACRKGEDSSTFYLSLKCHRHCYYCFNPNQEDYEVSLHNQKDCLAELNSIAKSGQKLAFIALTGGEPLLHKQGTLDFFALAQDRFPRAHTRLYTSGDLLDEAYMQELAKSGLKEIRFSIKLEDQEQLRRKVLDHIRLAKAFIPQVMVEMPVIPGSLEEMRELLQELNEMGIDGINLLEFCFPYHNAEEYRRRSFQIKNPPFKVLYDYWYAGGLPVAGSEEECLALLEYALDQKFQIGVHYCSLENKHTGQVFQQNKQENRSKLIHFSHKDFFLKTAKVFGDDIPEVLKILKKNKITAYRLNEQYMFLEFAVKEIKHLNKLNPEVGISSGIMEVRDGQKVLRELKIDLVYPREFDMQMI